MPFPLSNLGVLQHPFPTLDPTFPIYHSKSPIIPSLENLINHIPIFKGEGERGVKEGWSEAIAIANTVYSQNNNLARSSPTLLSLHSSPSSPPSSDLRSFQNEFLLHPPLPPPLSPPSPLLPPHPPPLHSPKILPDPPPNPNNLHRRRVQMGVWGDSPQCPPPACRFKRFTKQPCID